MHDYNIHSRPTMRIGNTREQAQTSCGIRVGSGWQILAFDIFLAATAAACQWFTLRAKAQ